MYFMLRGMAQIHDIESVFFCGLALDRGWHHILLKTTVQVAFILADCEGCGPNQPFNSGYCVHLGQYATAGGGCERGHPQWARFSQ